jgi:hypothetical protein
MFSKKNLVCFPIPLSLHDELAGSARPHNCAHKIISFFTLVAAQAVEIREWLGERVTR